MIQHGIKLVVLASLVIQFRLAIASAIQDKLVKIDGVFSPNLNEAICRSQENTVTLANKNDIVPFEDLALLEYEREAKPFKPFDFMTFIETRLGTPHYFPVNFNIYTREHNLTGIEFGSYLHWFRHEGEDESTHCREYEFNLSSLSQLTSIDMLRKRTIVAIPGYLTGEKTKWPRELADEWLKLEDVNVVTVDWSKGNHGIYYTAVSNIRIVSRQVTILLYYLAELFGADFSGDEFRDNIYLVGHSLGAHIAGWVGHELRGEIGRITGLDPAGPVFDVLPERDRLNPQNAQLVDVIHTNGGVMTAKSSLSAVGSLGCSAASCIKDWATLNGKKEELIASLLADYYRSDTSIYFGIYKRIGHLDFYANGGQIQPGCDDKMRICDHSRAVHIYINSIRYEYRARQTLGEASKYIKNGRHRLVAFPSSDYEKFKSGSAILKNCPELLKPDRASDVNLGLTWESFRRCSIPMDFVTPTKELVRELEDDYGLNLRKYEDPSLRTRYFFETTAAYPFVSEHLLLKVFIHQDEDDISEMPRNATFVEQTVLFGEELSKCEGEGIEMWDKGCRLRVIAKSFDRDDLHAAFNYEPSLLTPIDTPGFFGLALPVANPVDWNYYHPSETKVWLDRKVPVHESLDDDEGIVADLDPEAMRPENRIRWVDDTVINFLPHRFVIGLYHQSGIMTRAYDSLSNMLSKKSRHRCKINLVKVEVQPILSVEPYALASYEFHRDLDQCLFADIIYRKNMDDFYTSQPKQCVSLHSQNKYTTFMLSSVTIYETIRQSN